MKTTGTFTSTTTTTYKPATMDSKIKPALDSKISMSTQVAKGNSCESLHEDIGHRLSVQQEHKLDGLAAQRDRVVEEIQSLEAQLKTVEAAKDDAKAEMDQLDDLQQRDPEAAARSRELLADEIRHDHIGQSRAAIIEAINAAEAEDQRLEEAMVAVYPDESADGDNAGEDDDDNADDHDGADDDSYNGEQGEAGDEDDDREEQEYDRDDDDGPHDDDDDSPDADAGYDSPDAGYDSHDGGGFDRGGEGGYHDYH